MATSLQAKEDQVEDPMNREGVKENFKTKKGNRMTKME